VKVLIKLRTSQSTTAENLNIEFLKRPNLQPKPRLRDSKRGRQSGQNLIGFSLCFILFLSLLLALFNFGWALFTKATLHQAVQAAVRFAITGPDGGDAGQDAVIKDVVKRYSIGLINDNNIDKVHIDYFRPNCIDNPATESNECATIDNSARNIISVRITDYEVPFVAPMLTSVIGNGVTFSVIAMDKVEPFPRGASRRTPLPTP